MNKMYYIEKKLERTLSFLFGMFFLIVGIGGAVVVCVEVLTGVFLLEYLFIFVVGFLCVFLTLVGLMLLVMFLGNNT